MQFFIILQSQPILSIHMLQELVHWCGLRAGMLPQQFGGCGSAIGAISPVRNVPVRSVHDCEGRGRNEVFCC